MKNKKRVFMFGYTQDKGGVETYIDNLSDVLMREGFEVYINTPTVKIDQKEWILPKNRHNYIRYCTFWKSFYKENNFDVLYFNTCDIVSIDQLRFAKNALVPVRIIHSHNTKNERSIKNKLSYFHKLSELHSKRVLDRYASILLACSKAAGDWMFEGRNYSIIKNGIDLNRFHFSSGKRRTVRNKCGYNDEEIIGIIGRLSPQKNPTYAVNVLSRVFEEHPDYKAVFIGDGDLRDETRNAVIDARIDDKVQFIGAVDNVDEWLSAVDCLLMPSLFEGLPFILIEAQAAGLPCVVSSAVPQEVNITGLVRFVSLESSPVVWTKQIEESIKTGREIDTLKQLIDAGYSIEETGKKIISLINNQLKKAEES